MAKSIGIIGNGFVGQAIACGFSPLLPVYVHDNQELRSTSSLQETVDQADIIFVSVPTPMRENGTIDLSCVYDVFCDVRATNTRKDNIFVLKSTVTPGITESIARRFSDLNIVFSPEFLTERTSKFDFINPSRIILGGPEDLTQRVASLFRSRFGNCNIMQMDYKTAEFIKYFNNVFFSVKVSFMNEMRRVADKVDVDWETAVDGFVADGRIGHSHLQVPGPDGKFGFGGTCFPKDINAFMSFARSLHLNINVIEAAWQTNLEVRPERDWEKLEGRAVSKN
jgi:nucleotide sugar dehydrogenase